MTVATSVLRRYQCVALLRDRRPCGTVFDDDTGEAPCPRCGNTDDDLIVQIEDEPEAPARRPQRKTTHPVKSASTQNHRRGLIAWDRFPAWLIGTLILGLWWAIGGKYTVEGLPLLANLIGGWFHLPIQITPISDGRWYLYLCWLPLLISFVERQYRPWRNRAILTRERFWLVLLWLAVVALDAGATYLAVRNPAPGAWTVTRQVAASASLAATWSLLTTFGPESGLSWLWRYLRGA